MKHHLRILLALCALAWWLPLQAEVRDLGDGIRLEGNFIQGGMVIGQAPTSSKLRFQNRSLPLSADQVFVFGFGRDDASPQSLQVTLPDGKQRVFALAIQSREYDIQRVNGVAPRTVNPDPAELARIQKEQKVVTAAREVLSQREHFRTAFIWPVKGRISGVYGSQRIFNGEPRNPHFGLDIAAPEGTTIVAPADGVVTMDYADMFFSGDTLVIDHGQGISTSYLHMSKMLVKKGDVVKQGQPIGKVGAKGRATGPHLDWRLNWFQSRLDPRLLMPEPDPK